MTQKLRTQMACTQYADVLKYYAGVPKYYALMYTSSLRRDSVMKTSYFIMIHSGVNSISPPETISSLRSWLGHSFRSVCIRISSCSVVRWGQFVCGRSGPHAVHRSNAYCVPDPTSKSDDACRGKSVVALRSTVMRCALPASIQSSVRQRAQGVRAV